MDLKEVLSKIGITGTDKISLLAGDASTRKYYRAESNDGSYVIMQGDPYTLSDPNIINYNILKEAGVRVPEFIEMDPKYGVIIEEDIGSTHLQDIRDKGLLTEYYNVAIKNMQTYHRCRSDVGFTKQKFISELNMTIDYYVKAYNKRKMIDQSLVDAVNETMVVSMMDQPIAYLHRDYHSRNMMVKNGELILIDFQDARMGPYSYDIASMVIDPYISLEETYREQLVSRYYDVVAGPLFGVSKEEYRRHFSLCYLQRGIKMLGTFSYQSVERKRDAYLKYIPYVVDSVRKVSRDFGDWSDVIEEVYLR